MTPLWYVFVSLAAAGEVSPAAAALVPAPTIAAFDDRLTLSPGKGLTVKSTDGTFSMVSSVDLFGLNQWLAYNLFIGGGDGRNRLGGQVLGPLLVARVAVRPFGSFDDDSEGDLQREPRPRLSLGVAGALNVHTNRAQSTFGTTLTLGTFDTLHAAVR